MNMILQCTLNMISAHAACLSCTCIAWLLLFRMSGGSCGLRGRATGRPSAGRCEPNTHAAVRAMRVALRPPPHPCRVGAMHIIRHASMRVMHCFRVLHGFSHGSLCITRLVFSSARVCQSFLIMRWGRIHASLRVQHGSVAATSASSRNGARSSADSAGWK